MGTCGETDNNKTSESPAKSYATIDSDEMIADGNDDEWAVPVKKLNKDFDALASIVNGYSASKKEEDPQVFSIMVQKGLKNLTSTVTFSRALQESVRGEGSNTAIKLMHAFVSAKGITEEERRLSKEEEKLSKEEEKLSEQVEKLSEQHQELVTQRHNQLKSEIQDNLEDSDQHQHQKLSEQHQKLSEMRKQLEMVNIQIRKANIQNDIANIQNDIANIQNDIANKKYVANIEIRKANIQIDKIRFARSVENMIRSLRERLFTKYKRIAYDLRNMSNLSQSDPVTASSYSTMTDPVMDEMVQNNMIMGEWNFFEEAKSVEIAPSEFKHITKVDRLDSKLYEELKKINTNFQDYVSSATLLTKKEGGIEGFVTTFEKFLQSSSEVASNHVEKIYYPGIEAEEVACVKPFLKGLLAP